MKVWEGGGEEFEEEDEEQNIRLVSRGGVGGGEERGGGRVACEIHYAKPSSIEYKKLSDERGASETCLLLVAPSKCASVKIYFIWVIIGCGGSGRLASAS